MGQVLEENLPHELDLVVPGDAEHGRRQVPLERAEDRGAEIQLQVVVALGLVLLARVQPQPLVRHGRSRREDAVPDRRRVARAAVDRHGRSECWVQESAATNWGIWGEFR